MGSTGIARRRGGAAGGARRTFGSRGVTAVELLILVVLLVILAAFAVPGMSPVVLNLRLRGAAWQLGGDLRLARQRAVTTRGQFRICVTSCAISVPAGAYSLERKSGATWVSDTGAAIRLPEGVGVTATAIASFGPTGTASGSTFTLSNIIGSFEVTVHPTGRVRVCQGSCPS